MKLIIPAVYVSESKLEKFIIKKAERKIQFKPMKRNGFLDFFSKNLFNHFLQNFWGFLWLELRRNRSENFLPFLLGFILHKNQKFFFSNCLTWTLETKQFFSLSTENFSKIWRKNLLHHLDHVWVILFDKVILKLPTEARLKIVSWRVVSPSRLENSGVKDCF